jgi:hypothetical protein
MGTALSTLASHASEMQVLSYEAIMGLVLVIPLFVQYYKATLQSYSESEAKAHKVISLTTSSRYDIRYTSLLCGTLPMPALVPSSHDSVSTAVMSNTASALRSRQSQCNKSDDFKMTPQEIHITTQEINESHSPIRSPMGKTLVTAAESLATECDESGIPLMEEAHPISTPARPTLELLVETSEKQADSDTSKIRSRSKKKPKSSTFHYLEAVARRLSEKAHETKLHSDHVGIAQALMELADVLAQEEQHARALRVYQRAELVQRMVVQATLQAVASALRQKAKYHAEQPGHVFLAAKYQSLADELKAHPTPQNLTRTLQFRNDERNTRNICQHESPEQESLNQKLDRRLRRASAEAIPLVRSLKEQANCSISKMRKKTLMNL